MTRIKVFSRWEREGLGSRMFFGGEGLGECGGERKVEHNFIFPVTRPK